MNLPDYYPDRISADPIEYCGCCGNEMDGALEWCLRCSQHVGRRNYGQHSWDQTYFAINGVDCPFQVRGEVIR